MKRPKLSKRQRAALRVAKRDKYLRESVLPWLSEAESHAFLRALDSRSQPRQSWARRVFLNEAESDVHNMVLSLAAIRRELAQRETQDIPTWAIQQAKNNHEKAMRRCLRHNARISPDITPRTIALMLFMANSCALCGIQFNDTGAGITREIDHIVPIGVGGEHSKTNLQIVCEECHDDKDNEPRYGSIRDALLRAGLDSIH